MNKVVAIGVLLAVALLGEAIFATGTDPEAEVSNETGPSHISGSVPDSLARDSLWVPEPRFLVSIERLTVNTGTVNDTLSVFLESFGNQIAGFDLKFATESPFIDILEVLPGEVHDSCSWEFFNARQIYAADREDYPAVVWRVVALAETVPDEIRPVCFGLGRKTSLVRLVISSEHVRLVPDTTAAIFFFWEDCTDNTLSGLSGNTLALSERLIDYFPVEGYDKGSSLFPTRLGAPKQCIDPSSLNRPRRQIELHNGGVKFRLEWDGDSTDTVAPVGE